MKTIKQKSGRIERVSDKEAIVRVKTGGWDYCPKSEYKESIRTPKSENVNEQPKKGKSSKKA